MHRILTGIVNSDHPEDVKRNLIENKLIPVASEPMNASDCQSLLEVSWNLATDGDNEFRQSGGVLVFTAWCQHHKSALAKFFTQSHLIKALTSNSIHKDRMLQLVMAVLVQMEEEPGFPKLCCLVQTRCISLLKENSGSLSVCCSMVDILEHFPQCLPQEEFRGTLCSVLTQCIVTSPVPAHAHDLKSYIKDINRIASFMKSVWTLSEASLRRTLETISGILTGKDEKCSTALAAIVDLLPSQLVPTATQLLSRSLSGSHDVEPLIVASRRLLSCLNWPGLSSVHVWILAALQGFLSTRRFAAIQELFESAIGMVFEKMTQPLTRKCAFPVLSFMLLSYQHSPVLFHKVVPHVPTLVKMLKKEDCLDVIRELAKLSQSLMYLHSGFPDLYDPVLDALKDVATTPQEEIQALLSSYRMDIPEKYVGGIVGDSSMLAHREAELVGLENLGNTCYANSVLQALYMTSRLKHGLLQANIISTGMVLRKLQELFAFLALSQRPAVCPRSFLESAKPHWFEAGEQQDCSEFLRYLVDTSHEEEKSHGFRLPGGRGKGEPTLIEEVFGGAVRTTYHCLTCHGESANEEAITDLHLAFPEGCVAKGSGAEAKTYQTRSATKSSIATPDSDRNGTEEIVMRPLSLEDLLESYFVPESMEGDNRYRCDACGELRDARRTVALVSPPRHLILTLMRFSYDGATRTRSKILHNVAYPQLLILPSNCGLSEATAYALYAVVVHSGSSTERGHYFTYARRSSQESLSPRKSAYRPDTDPLSKKWYQFNDNRVTSASYSSIEGLTRRFPKDTAYVLFYKQINSTLAYQEAQATAQDKIHPNLRHLVDVDNINYMEEQEAKSKRARWSTAKNNDNGDSFEGGPSPPTGGCGGGMGGAGGLGDLPRVVF